LYFFLKTANISKTSALPSLKYWHLINGFQKFTISISVRSMKLTLTSALTAPRVSEKTKEMLSRETPDFISIQQWPPNSPDLKQLDYAICGKLQECIYRTQISDADHLVEWLVEEWCRFDHTSPVLQLLSQWQARLRPCVQAVRGHFDTFYDNWWMITLLHRTQLNV